MTSQSPLERKYVDTGKVLIVFEHLPLAVHQFAIEAAEVAECAGRQGKFWAVHDWFFADANRIRSGAVSAASEFQLDAGAFRKCLDAEDASAAVQRDQTEARKLQVTSTPTFFLGTMGVDRRVSVARRISGSVPVRIFVDAIEEILRNPNS